MLLAQGRESMVLFKELNHFIKVSLGVCKG